MGGRVGAHGPRIVEVCLVGSDDPRRLAVVPGDRSSAHTRAQVADVRAVDAITVLAQTSSGCPQQAAGIGLQFVEGILALPGVLA